MHHSKRFLNHILSFRATFGVPCKSITFTLESLFRPCGSSPCRYLLFVNLNSRNLERFPNSDGMAHTKLVQLSSSVFKCRSWPNSDGILPATCGPQKLNLVNLERLPTSQGTNNVPRTELAVTSSCSKLDSSLIPTSELERPSKIIVSSVSNLHVLAKLPKSTICTGQGHILKDFKPGKAQRSPIVAAELLKIKCFTWKLNPQRSSSQGASTALRVELRGCSNTLSVSPSKDATSPLVSSDALATPKSVSPSYTTSMRSAPCKAPSKPSCSWSRQSLNGKLWLVKRLLPTYIARYLGGR